MKLTAIDRIKFLLKLPGFTPEDRAELIKEGLEEINPTTFRTPFAPSGQCIEVSFRGEEFQVYICFSNKPAKFVKAYKNFEDAKDKLISFRPDGGFMNWKKGP